MQGCEKGKIILWQYLRNERLLMIRVMGKGGNMKTIILVTFALLITACAQPKPIPSSAIRALDKAAKTGTIEMPISQVKLCFERTEYNCGESGIVISQNPDNENEFTLRYYFSGGFWPNCRAMIVFTGSANKTEYTEHVLYDFMAKELDAQLNRMRACGECGKVE